MSKDEEEGEEKPNESSGSKSFHVKTSQTHLKNDLIKNEISFFLRGSLEDWA